MSTGVILGGAIVGLGLLLLGLVFVPPRTDPAAALARLDAERGRVRAERFSAATMDPRNIAESAPMRRFGGRIRTAFNSVGIELGSLRSDLSIMGKTLEYHLALTVLCAVGGFFFPVALTAILNILGAGFAVPMSVMAGLVCALLFAVIPTLSARSEAAERRRDFRHVVGSFLDLVAMSLAGGRGVPEALQSASELSDGWAMMRICDTLLTARLHGITPWAALGELGEELRIDELRDLASALALVAEDGAKVRDSLSARAVSMRRRELADVEGKAGERSQSMLVAQLLLAVAFLLYLLYPAVMGIFDL